jgi:hypothetical protein
MHLGICKAAVNTFVLEHNSQGRLSQRAHWARAQGPRPPGGPRLTFFSL